MADSAADVLGTPDIPANLAAVAPTGDATGVPTAIAAPAATPTIPTPSGTPVATDPGPADTAMIQGQPGPTYQDPEISTAAVHQNWLSRILDSVGTILGGDKTIVATKHPDGSISVVHNPSTTGEKWGRIAQAALGGAARGMAAGQGPGGAGKAFAAGAQAGLQQPQQDLDAANKEAANMSQQQLRAAQNARLNQDVVRGAWDNSHMTTEWNQKQAAYMVDFAQKMNDIGATPQFTNVKDLKQLAAYGVTNPLAVDAHLGKDGSVLVTMPDGNGDGGVSGWTITADKAKQKYDKDWDTTVLNVDPKDPLKTTESPLHIDANTTTNSDHVTREMAIWTHNNGVQKQIAEAKSQATTAGAAQTRAQTAQTEAQQKAPLVQAQTAAAGAEAALHGAQTQQINRNLTNQPGGQPVEVEDPNFPNPSNFPVGTLGIAKPPKTGDYKVPADADTAYRLSTIMRDSGNQIRQVATANPQLFGRLQGLLSEGKTIVGLSGSKDDQAIASLAGSIQQYAQASAGFHKFRNKAAPAETEDSSLNKFRNDPASIVAFLDSQKPALDQTDRLIRNYQVYGTAQGPSPEARAAAVARAPNAARFQGGGGAPAAAAPAAATVTPQTNTSQAAVVPQPKAITPGVTPLTPPPTEPVHPGRVYGNGPKGLGWYK